MGGIPYGLVLLVAVGVLAARYTRADSVPLRSKCVVGGLVVASILISPSWSLATTVVQLSLWVYLIFYRIVADELAKSGGGSEPLSWPTDLDKNVKSGPG